MPQARPGAHAPSPSRLPGTVAWFVALSTVVTLLLYAGPVTPSPGAVVPSVFMGVFFGALLTVLVRSGFQQRPRWDDDAPGRRS